MTLQRRVEYVPKIPRKRWTGNDSRVDLLRRWWIFLAEIDHELICVEADAEGVRVTGFRNTLVSGSLIHLQGNRGSKPISKTLMIENTGLGLVRGW